LLTVKNSSIILTLKLNKLGLDSRLNLLILMRLFYLEFTQKPEYIDLLFRFN